MGSKFYEQSNFITDFNNIQQLQFCIYKIFLNFIFILYIYITGLGFYPEFYIYPEFFFQQNFFQDIFSLKKLKIPKKKLFKKNYPDFFLNKIFLS